MNVLMGAPKTSPAGRHEASSCHSIAPLDDNLYFLGYFATLNIISYNQSTKVALLGTVF